MAKDYFSHDYNARNDKKLTKLFMKHGLEGVGAFWCIIEMIYEEGGYLNIDEYERITFELRTNYDLVKSVIHDFDLFEFDEEKFWSETAIERLKKRAEKSQKARESIEKRWKKYEYNTNVKESKNDSNTIKVKESKVKESKVNIEFPFKKSFLELGVEEKVISDWLKVRAKKKASNTETAFNGIKKQIEKSGLTANECIKIAAQKSWQGFESEWIKNNNKNNHPFNLQGEREYEQF